MYKMHAAKYTCTYGNTCKVVSTWIHSPWALTSTSNWTLCYAYTRSR